MELASQCIANASRAAAVGFMSDGFRSQLVAKNYPVINTVFRVSGISFEQIEVGDHPCYGKVVGGTRIPSSPNNYAVDSFAARES